MTITRWNPFREFEDILDRYNRSLQGLPGESTSEKNEIMRKADWAPAVDITENKEQYLIHAELPGVKKEDVKVTVHDNVLMIQGERRLEKKADDDKHHRIERFYGSFARSFSLPDNVDENHIKAEFKDGVLSLTLNKVEKAKPKSIEIDLH